jgi:hypothetical protein
MRYSVANTVGRLFHHTDVIGRDGNLNSEIVAGFRSHVKDITFHWKKITPSKPMYRTGWEESVRPLKHGNWDLALGLIFYDFLQAGRSCLV